MKERIKLRQLSQLSAQEKEEIYRKYKGLVASIAEEYLQRVKSLTIDDLIDEGFLGLFKAFEKFDSEKGCKFSSYAFFWIRQSIGKAVTENDPIICISGHMILKAAEYARAKNNLSQKLNREPSIGEIAEYMQTTIKRVKGIEDFIQHRPKITSLDSSTNEDDENNSLLNFFGDKRIKSPEDLTCEKAVKEQVESLTIQERTVVKLIFGLDDGVSRTPNKVGQKLHLTRERIRQILKRALEKMREKEQL